MRSIRTRLCNGACLGWPGRPGHRGGLLSREDSLVGGVRSGQTRCLVPGEGFIVNMSEMGIVWIRRVGIGAEGRELELCQSVRLLGGYPTVGGTRQRGGVGTLGVTFGQRRSCLQEEVTGDQRRVIFFTALRQSE